MIGGNGIPEGPLHARDIDTGTSGRPDSSPLGLHGPSYGDGRIASRRFRHVVCTVREGTLHAADHAKGVWLVLKLTAEGFVADRAWSRGAAIAYSGSADGPSTERGSNRPPHFRRGSFLLHTLAPAARLEQGDPSLADNRVGASG
jgi:hypothetical protein